MPKPARSIWKGHIRFSLVTIPIRIYSAVDTAQTVRFNQLHKECNGRVGYDKRCKKCNETVSNENIVKGYQYEPDQYAIVGKEDIEKIKLKSTKVIEIEGFVDADEIHTTLYETPYYAGPDGDVAAKTYGLLCAALKDSGKVGVGKVVLRDREDIVTISPHNGGILLQRLRYPKEIKSMKNVPLVGTDAGTDNEQLKLAKSLVGSMSKKLKDIKLDDKYGDAMRDLIDAKIAGKEIVAVEEEEKPVVDIMTALKQSIEQAKSDKKPMVKAGKAKAKAAKKTTNKKATKKLAEKTAAKKKTKVKAKVKQRRAA